MQEIHVTRHQLSKWTDSLYKKCGYIHLAKKHGHTDKVKVYKESITRLIESIENKWKVTSNTDRKDDLKILLDQAKFLKTVAAKI